MSDREALIAAVADAPEDDTPRLVFADWLDEHGEAARAEFVRVQCAAERLPPHDPRRAEALRRADELEFAHERDWLGPWADRLVNWEFRRGFLARARMTASAFRKHGEGFLRAEPVERLELVNDAGQWLRAAAVRAAVAAPAFALVRGCTVIPGDAINPGEETPIAAWLESLAAARHVTRLRAFESDERFSLYGSDVEEGPLRAFCSAPHLRTLAELTLRTHLPDRDATTLTAILASAGFAGNLTALNLQQPDLDLIAKCGAFGNLRAFSVTYTDKPAEWGAVFRSKSLAKLTDFDIPCSALADLADSPAAKRVRSLTVGWNEAMEQDLKGKADVWAKAVQTIRPPEKLVLYGHNPGKLGFESIRKAGWLRHAHTLEVRSDSQTSVYNDSADLCPLFAGAHLPALTHLTVHEVADRELLAALSKWPRIGELETLKLTDDYYGRMWLSHFKPAVPLARLRTVEGVVFDCDKDVDRFLGLLRGANLRRLVGGLIPQFRTRLNPVVKLTGPGFAKLLRSPEVRHLESLALGFDRQPRAMAAVRGPVLRALGRPDVLPRLRDVAVGFGSNEPRANSAIRKRFGPRLAT